MKIKNVSITINICIDCSNNKAPKKEFQSMSYERNKLIVLKQVFKYTF